MRRNIYIPLLCGIIVAINICFLHEKKVVANDYPLLDSIIREQVASNLEKISSIKDKYDYYVAYKRIWTDYPNAPDKPESIYDVFSESEITLLCRMVETECYQACFDAKCNVANVALNRLYSGDFGSSITEIITNKNQFAYGRTKISQDTVLAVEYAFEIGDTTNGCIGFRSDCSPYLWNRWVYDFTDTVGHHFYRKR